jgi:hypothetical protein
MTMTPTYNAIQDPNRTRGSGTQTAYATIRREILAMTLGPIDIQDSQIA